MADNRWEFDDSAGVHRFRDTQTGRFLSASDALKLRDGFPESQQATLREIMTGLAADEITVQEWERETRDIIRDTHAGQYVYGRGGLNTMDEEGWAAIRDLARVQSDFLRSFAQDVADGRLSEAQIAARANLYLASSRQAYERGRAGAWGVVPPHVPCDGSTPCGANCKCFLVYVDKPDEVHLTWKLQSGESCSGCKARARAWAPLVIAKPSDGRIARLYRMVA